MDTNVIGTLNVLEAARTLRTPRVVHTSTSETYGTACSVPITEDHRLQAQSPYAASKIAADKLLESYHFSYGLPVTTLRPFNTYGPRQSARAVIPTIMTQLAAGYRRVTLGALTPTRDFLFVTDTAAAFLAVGTAPEQDVFGQVFNAGTGTEICIGKLATMIAEIMDLPIELVRDDDRMRPKGSEVERLVCNSGKLRRRTQWRPRQTLMSGLAVTAEWFRQPANLARYPPGRHL